MKILPVNNTNNQIFKSKKQEQKAKCPILPISAAIFGLASMGGFVAYRYKDLKKDYDNLVVREKGRYADNLHGSFYESMTAYCENLDPVYKQMEKNENHFIESCCRVITGDKSEQGVNKIKKIINSENPEKFAEILKNDAERVFYFDLYTRIGDDYKIQHDKNLAKLGENFKIAKRDFFKHLGISAAIATAIASVTAIAVKVWNNCNENKSNNQ